MHQLIVFAKAPLPGLVKTRLAAVIGEDAACDAYRELLSIVATNLSEIPTATVQYSPSSETLKPFFPKTWKFRPQNGASLGNRLIDAFASAFETEAQRVVIIGSDCPFVTRAHIEAAWAALEQHDLVLGPAQDGGYWLVGLRELYPELFSGISWGTPNVLAQTLRAARGSGLTVQLLATLRDVDTFEDWENFCRLTRRG